jgi:hypothetical protein
MAARVAAIQVFGTVSNVVDGRATPGHDVRTARSSTRYSTGQKWVEPGHDVVRTTSCVSHGFFSKTWRAMFAALIDAGHPE